MILMQTDPKFVSKHVLRLYNETSFIEDRKRHFMDLFK